MRSIGRTAVSGLVLVMAWAGCNAIIGLEEGLPEPPVLPGDDGGTPVCVPGSETSCYTGPPNTQTVGECKAGRSTCVEDGSGFGPCVGQVLPGVEDCATPIDEDCDGDSPPCPGSEIWSRGFGDGAHQEATDVAVGAGGAIVLSGIFGGTLDLGGVPLQSFDPEDSFVARFDAGGQHVYSLHLGDVQAQAGGSQRATAVDIDESGYTLVAGAFLGTLDVGGLTLGSAGDRDGFVAKIDPNGNPVWRRRIGGDDDQWILDVAAGPGGTAVVVGYTFGPLDLGDITLPIMGAVDGFVVQLDPDGDVAWARAIAEPSQGTWTGQVARRVAVDSAANVFVAGEFEGTIVLDGQTLTSAGDMDGFLFKLGPAGERVWGRRFGDAARQLSTALAVGADGAVTLAGALSGSMNLGGGTLTSAGSEDVFLAKLDGDGGHVFSRRFGDGAAQRATAVAVAADGAVYLACTGDGTIDFGGGPLTSAGGFDVFAASFDPQGILRWSRRSGDGADQEPAGIGVEADVLAVGGVFAGALDFGEVPVQSAGAEDVFLARLTP